MAVLDPKYGFTVPQSGFAASADEAAQTAMRLGFPVVLKIVSPDILHKTDVGGVELDLASEAAVRAAFSRLMANVREKAPSARVEGVMVEEMCRQGTEVILGLTNDPQFGPIIMFGLGGIYTEVLHDVSFRVLPITQEDARSMVQEIRARAILTGFRRQAPVPLDVLVDLLMKTNRMGLDLADCLEAVDLNPVVVWTNQHRVLDAKILLRPEKVAVTAHAPRTQYLDRFFKAGSVALVGASATPGKIGNAVLDSLGKHDYRGKVYPINPSRDEVLGLKTYPSLTSIRDPVDLVVVTVALSGVPDLIRECAAKGIHNMVIISGGGKELGGESKVLEATIKNLAQENDVRVVGCNCLGVFDSETRLDTLFQPYERMIRPKNGPIALLTQSGTVGIAFLESVDQVGVSKFVSYGNRIDVDEADLMAYLADDSSVRVIACYIEGLDDGRKFLSTAAQVSLKKPIVVYKAGRTQRAASAVLSHTGFLGGEYGVSQGAFRQAGLIAVDSFEALCAAAKALAMQPRASGHRVAMISNGAGTTIQAMDLFEANGLEVMPLAAESVKTLQEAYPSFYQVQNPIDLTGSATSADYEVGIGVLLEDPNVDLVMPWFVFQDASLEEGIVDVVGRLFTQHNKPILCGAIGGRYTRRLSQAIEAQGVPVFDSVQAWVVAAHALAHGAASA